jgi:hypothetical protein
MFRGLKVTFGRMTDVQTAVQALQEVELFREKVGDFGSEMAMQMVMDPKTSPCKNYSPTTSPRGVQQPGGCCLDQAL